MNRFSDMFEFPLPDEVKKTIEDILREEGAKKELMRVAILQSMKRLGGEFRLSPEQSKSLDNLEQIIEVSSRCVRKYEDHPLVEGAVLLSLHQKIGEVYDFEILFILSDSALPPIEKKWREGGMGDKPVGGVWDEWEIFEDKKLPIEDERFEGKIIHCMFMTPQMISNEMEEAKVHPTHPLSMFQYGITLYDKKGIVKKMYNDILPASEEYFKCWKERRYGELENLLWSLESFLKRGDIFTAEIISVNSVTTFLNLMFAVEKKIELHQYPGSKRIMVASRKYLSPEIVERVEKVLLTHDLSERLRLLKDLRYSVAEKDEWMKKYHEDLMKLKRE